MTQDHHIWIGFRNSMVAEPMFAVAVGIDHVGHGTVGDRADTTQHHAPRLNTGSRIDDDHAFRRYYETGVAYETLVPR